jgi:KAP family P-loop domain
LVNQERRGVTEHGVVGEKRDDRADQWSSGASSVSVGSMAEPLVWPFLVVLMSDGGAVKSEQIAEAPRPRGLGWLVGEFLATLPHIAERADEAVTALDGLDLPVKQLGSHERFALLYVEDAATRERAVSPSILSHATRGARCTVAMVRDDAPDVQLLPGKVERAEPDGRFTVALDGTLPEDYTASGSPVVSADGVVVGIVGPTATSSSVDAFGLDELLRLISETQRPAATPSLEISEATRSALGYALALMASEGTPIGAPCAALLGVLRSAVDESRPTVPRDLVAFISERHDLPPSRVVDAAVSALGLPLPVYPPDPPPDDPTLQDSALAPVLVAAEAFRTRIAPEVSLRRRFLLLSVLTQPATSFPSSLFESLGVTLPEMRGALRESIASRPGEPVEVWDDVLVEPPEVVFDLLGGISADYVDPTKGIPLERDDLGVGRYATMLAAVIADKQTPMPLSFGLFGEWGSGKSYFMGLLRGQVAELAASGNSVYHSEIVQIGFNAWHYTDSNLWASLGDEIFERLAGPGETNEARRERLREELGAKLQRRKELQDAAAHATLEIVRLTRGLDDASIKRETTAGEFLSAVLSTPKVGAELQRALARIGVTDQAEQARLLADELSQTPEDIAVLRRALRGWRPWLVLVVLAVAAAGVVLGAIASRLWLTGTGLVIATGIVAAAGWLIVRVRSGAQLLHQVADGLRREQATKLAAPLDKLRRAEAEQQVLQAQLDEVTEQVGELGRELTELSPGQRLYRFIAERAASETYRGQLGLISTIRKDFEQLLELMQDWQTRDPTEEEPDPPKPIDRIVLYIDDLDRCSPEQVVDVLQAVHLLLALDLFVVVVGVDPRWLLRALRRQYRAMLTTGTRPTGQDPWWETTPQDYLEKIFNIPFVLPRMSPASFEQLVRSISAPASPPRPDHEAGSDVGTATAPTDLEPEPTTSDVGGPAAAQSGIETAELPVEAGSEVAALQTSVADPEVRPLTDPELTMLAALAPLVETPRETKRILNLYRIIRSTRALGPASRFLGDDHTPGDHQAVVILLGLLSGHARLLEDVLAAPTGEGVKGGLRFRPSTERWADFVAGMQPRRTRSKWANNIVGPIGDPDLAGWTRLAAGLSDASALVTIPDLAPFQLWAPRIARFSFLLSPYAQDEGAEPTNAEKVAVTSLTRPS